MKNQKGVTLVALVVTIIVLLILAGVSIAMLTGPNGVFSKASESAVKTEAAEVKENVELAISTRLTVAMRTSPTSEDAWSVSLDDVIKEINDTNALETVSGSSITTYEAAKDTLKATDKGVVADAGTTTAKLYYKTSKNNIFTVTFAETSSTDVREIQSITLNDGSENYLDVLTK